MMKPGRILVMGWENMKQRKLRTTLTTLGVVIGITAIIGLASLGEGFRVDIKQRMQQGFELDVLIIFPGSFAAGFRPGQGFNFTDVESIRSVYNVTLVTPMITLPTADLRDKNNSLLGALSVGAINFTEMQTILPRRFHLLRGSFPASGDNGSIVLGYKVAIRNDTVLADVGDNVTFIMGPYKRVFKVVGVLERGGTPGITNFDYWAFIPINVTLEMLPEQNYQIILVKIVDPQSSDQVTRDIESKFKRYSISVFDPSSLVSQVDTILNVVELFLLAIAFISLLVAGVGIMNIMTVSVVERTREIGILKAIGAKSRTVLGMFLAEALLVGLLGGLIGLFTGYGLSYALAYALTNIMPLRGIIGGPQTPESQRIAISPVFSPEWTVIAFVFSIVICVVFGLYPARKAAKLDPVKALRYE
jgi:putative ABC transport system permease protein